jgi:hypothetical protein
LHLCRVSNLSVFFLWVRLGQLGIVLVRFGRGNDQAECIKSDDDDFVANMGRASTKASVVFNTFNQNSSRREHRCCRVTACSCRGSSFTRLTHFGVIRIFGGYFESYDHYAMGNIV